MNKQGSASYIGISLVKCHPIRTVYQQLQQNQSRLMQRSDTQKTFHMLMYNTCTPRVSLLLAVEEIEHETFDVALKFFFLSLSKIVRRL